jgi:hypothetical protein
MKTFLCFVSFLLFAFAGRVGLEYMLLLREGMPASEGASILNHLSPFTLLVVTVTSTVGYLFSYAVFGRSHALMTALICGTVATLMFAPYLVAMRFSDWQLPAIVFSEWVGIGLLAHLGRSGVTAVCDAAERAWGQPKAKAKKASSVYVLD